MLDYIGAIWLKLEKPRKILHHKMNLFVSSYGSHTIHCIDLSRNTRARTIRSPTMRHPRGLAVFGRRLYVACYGQPMGNIVCINLETHEEMFHIRVPRPRGVLVYGRHLVVTEVMTNRLSVYTLNGLFCKHVYGGMRHPRGIAVDSMGQIVVADSGNNRIVWFDSDMRVVRTCSGLYAPNDVVICPDNTIVVSEWYNKSLRVLTPYATRFEPEFYRATKLSGNFTMMGRTEHFLLVSDNDLGCVHVFVRTRASYATTRAR